MMANLNAGFLRQHLAALRSFEAVANCSSITLAAEQLGVTPGAISQQIRQLEQVLEVDLLVREHRRVRVAPEAEELAACLSSGFEQIELALLHLTGGVRPDTLRLRMLPSFAIRWLVPRLGSFHGTHPEIELEISTSPKAEDIAIENTDISVRLGDGNWADAVSDHLFPDALVPVCTPELGSCLRDVSDISDQQLIHSMGRLDAWEAWLAAQGLSDLVCKRNVRMANAALVCQAAVDGLGISLTQYAYVEGDLAAGRLVMPFSYVHHTGQGYYLVCSRRRSRSPKVKAFRAWISAISLPKAQDSEC